MLYFIADFFRVSGDGIGIGKGVPVPRAGLG
jgi:hypothetical protein